jgi:hypothetical protein
MAVPALYDAGTTTSNGRDGSGAITEVLVTVVEVLVAATELVEETVEGSVDAVVAVVGGALVTGMGPVLVGVALEPVDEQADMVSTTARRARRGRRMARRVPTAATF